MATRTYAVFNRNAHLARIGGPIGREPRLLGYFKARNPDEAAEKAAKQRVYPSGVKTHRGGLGRIGAPKTVRLHRFYAAAQPWEEYTVRTAAASEIAEHDAIRKELG